MQIWDRIAEWLVALGALNWGLVGLFGFNLVEWILPAMWAKIIYIVIGILGVFVIVRLFQKI